MKKNLWLIFGMMLSCGLCAQDLTNSPAASAIQPAAPELAAPAVTNAAPAKPKAKAKTAAPKKKKSVASKRMVTPDLRTVPLVPGPASVVASNVNVRGQASFKGEVVARLTKGDQVTVIEEVLLTRSAADEPSAWAKIVLPAAARVFVNGSFINQADGTVTARRLNLRGGPGENYSVLGRLQKGDVVKVTNTKDGWVQIEPPTNAYAFMAAQYLKQETPATIAAAPATQVDTNTPATAATVQEPATVAAAPTTDLSVPPSTNATPDTAAGALAAGTDSGSVSNAAAGAEMEEEEPPPPRIVLREGVVRGTVSVQAPTRFELWSPESRQVINYLHTDSTQLDLSRYKGLRIIVKGEESLDERWLNTPVIEIQKIDVIE